MAPRPDDRSRPSPGSVEAARPATPSHVFAYGTARTSSFSWAVLGRIGVQLVQLIGTLVLGRIVAPSQFGVFAAAMFVVALGQIFNDLGIGPAIVAREQLDDHFLRTAFWLNAGVGVVLWLGTVALAYPLAQWYGYRSLDTIVPLLGLCFALSVSTVGFALMERRYRFKAVVSVELCAIALGQGTAICVAVLHPTVLAIALSPVVATAAMSVGALLFSGWRPGWRPTMRRSDLREIRGFVSYLSLFNLATFAARNSDDFFLGRHVAASALGYYSRSYQLMLLPVSQITAGLARVLRPAFAQARNDLARLQRTHVLAEVGAVAVGLVAGVALFCTAPSAIPVLLGPHWDSTVGLLQIFAISLPTQMVAAVNGALYVSTGNVRLLLASGSVNAAFLVAAFVVTSNYGVTAVAVAFVIHSYASSPVAVLPICRRLDLRVAPLFSRIVVLLVPVGALLAVLELVPTMLGLGRAGAARLICQLGCLVVVVGLGAGAARSVGLQRLRRYAQGGAWRADGGPG